MVSTWPKRNSVDGHMVINVLFMLIINLIIRNYEDDIEEAEWFRLTLFCVPLSWHNSYTWSCLAVIMTVKIFNPSMVTVKIERGLAFENRVVVCFDQRCIFWSQSHSWPCRLEVKYFCNFSPCWSTTRNIITLLSNLIFVICSTKTTNSLAQALWDTHKQKIFLKKKKSLNGQKGAWEVEVLSQAKMNWLEFQMIRSLREYWMNINWAEHQIKLTLSLQ